MTKQSSSLIVKALLTGSALCILGTAVSLVAPAEARTAKAVPFDGAIAEFYRARGGAPLWFGPNSGGAADQLVQLLATAQADHLNPRRYDVRGVARAAAEARSGNPAAVQPKHWSRIRLPDVTCRAATCFSSKAKRCLRRRWTWIAWN